MQAKELMIGDIVSWKGNICYIYSIEHFGGLVGIENDKICELVSDKELEPITITEDILKANGLNKNGAYNDYILRGDIDDFIGYNANDKHVRIRIDGWKALQTMYVSANFVHELQHALRLCGLNDLADSFKI